LHDEREKQQGDHAPQVGPWQPGSGVVARHPDGLVSSAGKLDDGRWFCMAVTGAGRGAFSIGNTHAEAVAQVCDDLGLSKARIIGGRCATRGPEP
jgi:hypothetical protein